MNTITITAHPHDRKDNKFNITLHYGKDNYTKLPFVSQSGTCTIPHKGKMIKKIPLQEGFTFSGKVLDEPIVDEEKRNNLNLSNRNLN